MSGRSRKKGRKPQSRAYLRLTKPERRLVEEGLDRGDSCRKIAELLGRSPSTVHDEVERHRYVSSPKAQAGEHAPEEGLGDACPRLGAWPRCCNGCSHRKGYGCSRKPRVFYDARLAQKEADAVLSEARRGVDETEGSFLEKVAVIEDCLARGLSPEQIAHAHPELGRCASTIYEWIDRGYAGLSNMELRSKVSYKPRKHSGGGGRHASRHSPDRSHSAFCALPEGIRKGAWEMDTVEGRKGLDRQCLLTLYHRPTSFQLALLLAEKTPACVEAGLGLVSRALGGAEGMRRVFGTVLTDNGEEFSDEAALAAIFGERPGETRLYYCDTMSAWQKGGCERNHSEIRKILPKGKGIMFDRLDEEDCSLLMVEVNSEIRGKDGWSCPSLRLLEAFGPDARALLDAFHIELIGPDRIVLEPACLVDLHRKEGKPALR